jgi:hypothetical protein
MSCPPEPGALAKEMDGGLVQGWREMRKGGKIKERQVGGDGLKRQKGGNT